MHARIICIFAFAATAMGATAAHASPTLTVLDFNGPRVLAERGHAIVLDLVRHHYELVPAERWNASNATTTARHPWARAAAETHVDNVIEGWISNEGARGHMLTVEVRDAKTGVEIDTASVKISDAGAVTEPQLRKLSAQLDDLVDDVDADASPSTDAPAIEIPDFSGLASVWADDMVAVAAPVLALADALD
jgi:hypothetical protein